MMPIVAQTISPAEPRLLRPYSNANFRDILGRTTYSCVQGPCSILLRWWFSVPYFASNMAVEYLYEHPRYVGKDKLPENRYNPLDLAEWKTSARRLRSTSPPFRFGDRVDRETSRLGARPKHHPDHWRHGQQFSISTDCDDRHPTANAKKSNPAVWSPDFRQRQTWDGRVQVGCASITIKAIAPDIVHHHLVLDDLPTLIASAVESSLAPPALCFRRTCPNHRPSHRAGRRVTCHMQKPLPIINPLP
ncbi:hypothetical protein BDP55DRAFT_95164 [Colletotrichum godetiae]|uniref:Uncharacterized protein n=1 Tax=Colletotrichum godetiae TaxID=1209918 RepID=A0AAJ0A5N3_9PEZI|nr:uncharacterized protein BDP55DRAFT_95164 [Colletotrichum godetiae]KAK1656549.1 hypothetical protein BDP55DRAFT_95164 [Colletotrichum godetiae]